ncbi:hypothetical protein psal_cds_719 [Pandoravirus salinus]|uniref:Uncharacterized protein n=1 Tax=Pandoravirus salinus TaxID=1349410 RepID=S4W2G9_9VIRU|nr:hypothetical protein psal_cds_719 [Pandoravirus salinus]AGO84692.1 hypothetical protein psal_cds_719 [Pandoravirus salinus]
MNKREPAEAAQHHPALDIQRKDEARKTRRRSAPTARDMSTATTTERDSQRDTSILDDECIGLAHMPPEILLHIGEAVSRPRDLLSAQIASSLFAGTSLRGLAAWWGAKRLGGQRLADRLKHLNSTVDILTVPGLIYNF